MTPAPHKIKDQGPFKTAVKFFDRGERKIIVRLTPAGLVYRLSGQAAEYFLPHEAAVLKAMSVKAGVVTEARTGRMRRGEQNL